MFGDPVQPRSVRILALGLDGLRNAAADDLKRGSKLPCAPSILKLDPQAELQIARGIIAIRRQVRARSYTEACRICQIQTWICEIDIIEQIEGVGGETQLDTLGNRRVLADFDIEIPGAESVNRITFTSAPVDTQQGNTEIRRGLLWIGEQIDPCGRGSDSAGSGDAVVHACADGSGTDESH